MQKTEKWHCFCDTAYYHYWAVQHKEQRDFYQAIHVNTKEEAEYLVEQLNKLERYEAALSGIDTASEVYWPQDALFRKIAREALKPEGDPHA
jgi:uncharacterized lipoprotein YehR (DUF1307 family)